MLHHKYLLQHALVFSFKQKEENETSKKVSWVEKRAVGMGMEEGG